MSFETILNLVWLLLSAIPFVALGVSASGRGHKEAGFFQARRLVPLFLLAIFIFPCISASDDLWSFQNLRATPVTRGVFRSRLTEIGENATWRLAHFFENLQTLTLSKFCTLSSYFNFLRLVFSPSVSAGSRSLLRNSGRSPPAVLSLI